MHEVGLSGTVPFRVVGSAESVPEDCPDGGNGDRQSDISIAAYDGVGGLQLTGGAC